MVAGQVIQLDELWLGGFWRFTKPRHNKRVGPVDLRNDGIFRWRGARGGCFARIDQRRGAPFYQESTRPIQARLRYEWQHAAAAVDIAHRSDTEKQSPNELSPAFLA